MAKKLDLYAVTGCKQEKNITLQYVYKTFRNMCFERLMTIFIWDGFPFPSREIDYRYYKSGAVAIVQDDKIKTMATWANLTGVTEYLDVFKYVTYAAPTAAGGTKTIGVDAVVSYNNSLHQQLQSHIDLYASLLAHAYMSIKLALVNSRYQEILLVDNDQTRESVKEWYRSLYDGKPLAILDNTLIGVEKEGVANLAPANKNINVIELINAYNELWRGFYRDIGIRFTKDKRANMTENEVVSDEQLLLYNIDDMLRQRKQLCTDYNALFVDKMKWQTKYASVKLNPLFEVIRKEHNADEKDDSGLLDNNE